ncbi:MAG: Nif3-like dinuclear metal center hexameric protein [Phycisphaerales bacterium JB039]
MRVQDLMDVMEQIAPSRYAESWDNTGLVLGDPEVPVTGPIVLAIDLSAQVLEEAVAKRASAMVVYHPPIWTPLKRMTTLDARQRLLLTCAARNIALYSPHTALDAAPGGVTDWLCEALSGSDTPGRIAGDCRALLPHTGLEPSQELKIVTFVPPDHADAVRSALATAGAGMIGQYTQCSFNLQGSGTFFGSDESSPVVGERGRLERIVEIRMEMVCSRAALPIALETLRRFHPYEEPAIDVYELIARPERSGGAGRRITLDRPATLRELGQRMKDRIGCAMVKLAAVADPDAEVRMVGVCPGAGASLAEPAARESCEAFVTGEMKHHEVLASVNRGVSILLGGHTATERGYLPRLRDRLAAALPQARIEVSEQDRSPLIPV